MAEHDGRPSFYVATSVRKPLVAAVLPLVLSLVFTVMAYASASHTASLTNSPADSDFATVTENASSRPDIKVFGGFIGEIAGGDLFYIKPAAGYNGHLVATVTLANVDKLIKCYREVALLLQAIDSSGSVADINLDSRKNDMDHVLLTLHSGAVSINLAGPDTYNIRLKSGYYISHVYCAGWMAGDVSPIIQCKISQK